MQKNKMTKSEIHSIQVVLCVDFDFYSARAINSSKKRKFVLLKNSTYHSVKSNKVKISLVFCTLT